MAELQSRLNKLGFSAGRVDGSFGPKTANAIRAYQLKYGQHIDGKPTYTLLANVQKDLPANGHNDTGTGLGTLFAAFEEPTPKILISTNTQLSRCVNTQDKTLEKALDLATEQIPVDIKPYLKGFCLPETKQRMTRLYLFLVGRGAMHSRLTLLKYDALVEIYTQAGVDLGVRKDAFRRSIETLDEDMRRFSKDREHGAKRLLDNYESEEVRTLLENLPEGYEKLEAKYKTRAREIMSEALSHSISSTFYLVRSGYTAKRLIDFIDLKKARSTQNVWETIKIKATQIVEGLKIGYFIADKREEMSNMLVASAHSVKTLSEDIKDIPRIDPAETDRELVKLREENGISLDEFEVAIEEQQQEQLETVEV